MHYCYSVAQPCPTLCGFMDCRAPGLPIQHQLPKPIQAHVHQVGDAIQPSHPLLSPFSSHLQSFPASRSFPVSQLFSSGGQSIGASASVLPMKIQDWFPLGLTVGLIVACCPRDSQESSPAAQFENINSSALSLLYGPTLTSIHDHWKNHSLD